MGSRVVEKERESSASFQLVRVTGGYRSLGKLDFLITLSLSFVEDGCPEIVEKSWGARKTLFQI